MSERLRIFVGRGKTATVLRNADEDRLRELQDHGAQDVLAVPEAWFNRPPNRSRRDTQGRFR